MTKQAHVLVPVDGSAAAKRAVGYGTLLADRLSARISFTRVRPPIGSTGEPKAADDEADALLNAIAVCYPHSQHAPSLIVGTDIACAICDSFPDAILVVGSDHAARHIAGAHESIAEALVREVHNHPIVVVGPQAESNSLEGPIAIALDGSKIAEEALLGAVAWSRLFDTPVHLVQVVPSSAFADQTGWRSTDYLESVQAHFAVGGLECECYVVVDDDPVIGLVNHLRNHECSLIAMATHARRGVAREAMGSVTMGVVAASPCAVCAVHPDTVASLELPAGSLSAHAQVMIRS